MMPVISDNCVKLKLLISVNFAKAKLLKAEHVKNMNKLQVEDAQEKKGKNKIELDHQKRMLDLEYEKTKSDQAMVRASTAGGCLT